MGSISNILLKKYLNWSIWAHLHTNYAHWAPWGPNKWILFALTHKHFQILFKKKRITVALGIIYTQVCPSRASSPTKVDSITHSHTKQLKNRTKRQIYRQISHDYKQFHTFLHNIYTCFTFLCTILCTYLGDFSADWQVFLQELGTTTNIFTNIYKSGHI